MKLRVTALALILAIAANLVLPGFAAAAEEGAAPEEIVVSEPQSGVYLDGKLVETIEYQIQKGVCYVTVESFVTALNGEAMVEEENGTVTASASTVAGVVDVEMEEVEGTAVPADAAQADEAGADEAEADKAEEPVAQAGVVEETLTVVASAGASYLVANGRYLYASSGMIQLNGKVAAPVRTMAKVYNLNVSYDGETGSVLLTHREGASAYLEDGDSYYDEKTLYWLSRIIHAESGNQPLAGRLAVGNVVMNRVKNPRFPNNIYDVLFQKNQFSPAASGSIHRTPNEGSVVAAKLVLDGAQVVNALFFNRAGLRCYASRNCTYVATIGDHAFYK